MKEGITEVTSTVGGIPLLAVVYLLIENGIIFLRTGVWIPSPTLESVFHISSNDVFHWSFSRETWTGAMRIADKIFASPLEFVLLALVAFIMLTGAIIASIAERILSANPDKAPRTEEEIREMFGA